MVPFTSLIQNAITAGKSIILKPNGVGPDTTADSNGYNLATTSVYALAGLIEFIRSINATYPITIAEASYTSNNTSFDSGGFFTSSNWPSLVSSYSNVTLVDLNSNKTSAGATAGYAPVVRHLWHWDLKTTDAIYAAPIYVNPMGLNTFIISVCRPKTHNNVVVTCTTKNMCMGMPLASIPTSYTSTRASGGSVTTSKNAMHDGSPGGQYTGEDKVLEWNIFQNASQFVPLGHPDLAICDAWEGMQGQGPDGGTPVLQYCMIAGTDNLAVDRLAVKLVGISDTEIVPQASSGAPTPSYSDCRYLLWQSNAGFGNYNLNKINFISGYGSLATLSTFIKQYTLATNYTASPFYETAWQGADTTGPTSVLDSQYVKLNPTAVQRHAAMPYPYLDSQKNLWESGVVGGNEIKIDFILPGSFLIDLGIYNIKGQEVRRLGHEYLNGGSYYKVWDGRDNHGQRVANGNYIIKLQFGERAICDKVALAR